MLFCWLLRVLGLDNIIHVCCAEQITISTEIIIGKHITVCCVLFFNGGHSKFWIRCSFVLNFINWMTLTVNLIFSWIHLDSWQTIYISEHWSAALWISVFKGRSWSFSWILLYSISACCLLLRPGAQCCSVLVRRPEKMGAEYTWDDCHCCVKLWQWTCFG